MAAITDAFATSDLPMRVDVVACASTSDAFCQIMARDKVVLQRATSLEPKPRERFRNT